MSNSGIRITATGASTVKIGGIKQIFHGKDSHKEHDARASASRPGSNLGISINQKISGDNHGVAIDIGPDSKFEAGEISQEFHDGDTDVGPSSPPVEKSHPAQVVHTDVFCDGCGQNPMIGVRHHCLDCANYDLCSWCKAKNDHPSAHKFMEIKDAHTVGHQAYINLRRAMRETGKYGDAPATSGLHRGPPDVAFGDIETTGGGLTINASGGNTRFGNITRR